MMNTINEQDKTIVIDYYEKTLQTTRSTTTIRLYKKTAGEVQRLRGLLL